MFRLRHRLALSLAAAALLAGCFVDGPSAERAEARSSERVSASSSRTRAGERWSTTDPPINLTHLFEGQINKRGKPVGFHARPGGADPGGARLVRVIDGPNRLGVYVAKVEIRASSGRWQGKTSTLYPDEFSEEDVIAAILAAYGRSNGGEKWRGNSGAGFTIEGYFQNGRINTAYPIFVPGGVAQPAHRRPPSLR